MRMRTILENGVLHNRQQPQSVVMAFVDHGESEAMKMPIGHRVPRCDKDQFRTKMTVSTSTVCEISLLNIVVITRMRKMALSLLHTFAFSCLPRGFWPLI